MKRSLLLALSLWALSVSSHASWLDYGDVVQVQNRHGSVFTPSAVLGDSNGLSSRVSYQINGGTVRAANAGLYVMDYSYQLNSAASQWQEFYSFCLEPHVALSSFSNPYTAFTVAGAGYPSQEIAELWGRYRNSVVNDITAAAFQASIWEIAFGSDTSRDLSTGAFRLSNTTSTVYLLATQWLNSLNGNGPMAHNLLVLADNPSDRNNRQDLLTEIPSPTGLLLIGVGLLGLSLRKRL